MRLNKRIWWYASPIFAAVLLLAVGLPGLVRANPGPVAVGTTSMPNAEVGVAYSQTLAATGGTTPYTWAITTGGLPAGLSINTSSGVISGTPTTVGSSTFTAQVTDSSSPVTTATQSLTITVQDQVAITTTSLAGGEVGVAYSQTLAAAGGVTPYTWSVSAGTLPAGLALNASTGAISGTPTAAGTTNITAQVADAAGGTATKALSITIGAPVAIGTTSLPNATVGTAYSQTLAATGGVTPYGWSLTSGALPAGLSLNATTGVISGTPTAAGTSMFTVQVTDLAGGSATRSLSIAVAATPVSITTTSLDSATVGVSYSQMLAATGGVTPYTWSVTTGALPAGLSLNAATGEISGTPTAAGTSTLTVQVSDSQSTPATATKSLTITVNPFTALAITTASLPDATVGTAYSKTLQATGGITPYSWSVIAGGLPAGLSLNAGTGVISGTPTAAGASTFTIQVTDSESPAVSTSKSYTLTVGTSTPSGQNPDVVAACQDTSGHPALPALCRIYMSGQLPHFAQGVIGRVILKLANREHPKAKHEDKEQNEANEGNEHKAKPNVQTSFESHGKMPGWVNFSSVFQAKLDAQTAQQQSTNSDCDKQQSEQSQQQSTLKQQTVQQTTIKQDTSHEDQGSQASGKTAGRPSWSFFASHGKHNNGH